MDTQQTQATEGTKTTEEASMDKTVAAHSGVVVQPAAQLDIVRYRGAKISSSSNRTSKNHKSHCKKATPASTKSKGKMKSKTKAKAKPPKSKNTKSTRPKAIRIEVALPSILTLPANCRHIVDASSHFLPCYGPSFTGVNDFLASQNALVQEADALLKEASPLPSHLPCNNSNLYNDMTRSIGGYEQAFAQRSQVEMENDPIYASTLSSLSESPSGNSRFVMAWDPTSPRSR
ncbi:hypothetical protein BJ875DRAFT_495430 [Amylocarpus encephaloides]|uniref:Uncharacterized protein n=1 Tax=Amylocarpus encephaloides TaxID=45428 RepID=A0A9P7YK03_9HELO|nr:hypothetical protein BJ875DRAFT_495430 [Amylocarpus encephaloides]